MATLEHSKTKAKITVTDAQANAILAGQERSKVKREKTGTTAEEAFTASGGRWAKAKQGSGT